MGKAGKWGGHRSDHSQGDAYYWQDYSGYAADPRSWQPPRKNKDKAPLFPKYDTMTIVEASKAGTPNGPASGSSGASGGDFVKIVQKLTNNLRRAEQRIRKNKEERGLVDGQWASFQKGLKESFMRERARYKECSDRLLHEEGEAARCQESAVEELYRFLADPKTHIGQKTAEAARAPREAQDEWNQLMETTTEENDDALSGLLVGAMGSLESRQTAARKMMAVLERHRETRERDRTPPPRRTRQMEMSPPATHGPRRAAHLPMDRPEGEEAPTGCPFVTSPTARNLLPSTPPRSRSGSQRVPVKAKGRNPKAAPPQAPSLSEKLEASREMMRAERDAEQAQADGEEAIIGNLRAAPLRRSR